MVTNLYKETLTDYLIYIDVPVIFEDDVSYRAEGNRGGGTRGDHGRDTLLSALPAVLKPSTKRQELSF